MVIILVQLLFCNSWIHVCCESFLFYFFIYSFCFFYEDAVFFFVWVRSLNYRSAGSDEWLTWSCFSFSARFSRGSVQTTLPPNRRARAGRLCCSIDDQISNIEMDISRIQNLLHESRGKKRHAQDTVRDLEGRVLSLKVRILNAA